MNAPNFCMLLRKHIGNGRITRITQPGLERIIQIQIEHLDDLGDLCQKTLVVEIMGKHSNIIFCDADGRIIDSIKHISAQMSSVREVLPGRPYFIPDTMGKKNPLTVDADTFIFTLKEKPCPLGKAIYTSFTGNRRRHLLSCRHGFRYNAKRIRRRSSVPSVSSVFLLYRRCKSREFSPGHLHRW